MAFAGGVSEALIATAAGKVQKLISDLEGASTHLIAILRAQVDRHAGQQAGAPARRAVREDYPMPVPSHLTEDRPDLHGI